MSDKSPTTAMIERVASLNDDNTEPYDLRNRTVYAKVLRVIDGDTLVLGFILFRTRWRARCRCAHFNCAERHSASDAECAAAECARGFVARLLMGQVVIAQFGANDKYGRPLVDIGLLDGRKLAQIMIDGGYAAKYEGRGDKKW